MDEDGNDSDRIVMKKSGTTILDTDGIGLGIKPVHGGSG